MQTEESKLEQKGELPDAWWYKVYAGVFLVTAMVILSLWAFTQHFSR